MKKFIYLLLLSSNLISLETQGQATFNYSEVKSFWLEGDLGSSSLITLSTFYGIKTYSDKVYSAIDKIPKFIRRPWKKLFGLALDEMQGLPQVYTSFSQKSYSYSEYKSRVPFVAYGQAANGCGEVAISSYLKNLGYPIARGEIDNQWIIGGWSVHGSMLMELRRRGYTAFGRLGSWDELRDLISAGTPAIISIRNGYKGHYATFQGYSYDFNSNTRLVEVANWLGTGKNDILTEASFRKYWSNADNFILTADPFNSVAVSKLANATSLRQPEEIYDGFSVSDIWVSLNYSFIEFALRETNKFFDITLKFQSLFIYKPKYPYRYKAGISCNFVYKWLEKGLNFDLYFERLPDYFTYNDFPVEIYAGISNSKLKFRAGFDGNIQAMLSGEIISGFFASITASMVKERVVLFATIELINL